MIEKNTPRSACAVTVRPPDDAPVEPSGTIVESAVGHAIVTLDPAGAVASWNAGAEQLLGRSREEVLGRSGDIAMGPEEREEGWLSSLLLRTIETGRAVNEGWHTRRDGTRVWLSSVMTLLRGAGGKPQGFLNILCDQTEAQAASEHRQLLMAEMNHRIKNTFAVVQAMASSTGRHAASVADFQTAFEARLMVMARSHEMLMRGNWRDTPLRDVIVCALAPFDAEPPRVALRGAPLLLASNLVIAVSLAFTNSRPTRSSTARFRRRTAGSR